MEILLESGHQKLKVVGVEGYVGIEVADNFIRDGSHFLHSGVESIYFASEAPIPVLREFYKLHPVVSRQIFRDDRGGVVKGAVVDNNPLCGQQGLADHRLNGLLDVSRLIAGWCNQHISKLFS